MYILSYELRSECEYQLSPSVSVCVQQREIFEIWEGRMLFDSKIGERENEITMEMR